MASTSARVCAYSLVPFHEHDEAIIRLLAMPVTDQMIHYIACRLAAAVGSAGHHHLPTPPVTPIRGKFALNSAPCAPEWDFPPLEMFLKDLVSCSLIHTAAALGSMIYLKRIVKGLQSGTIKHGPETPYRLAVALFTVASKYSHDIAPSTAHWAVYTAAALGIPSLAQSISRQCSSHSKAPEARRELHESQSFEPTSLGYLFGPEATAALERDILFLLDFNMRIDEEDLRDCLNALSSHERAEGPLEQLRLGQGRPELMLGEGCLSSTKVNSVMGRTTGPRKPQHPKQAPITPHIVIPGPHSSTALVSPPCTPTRGTLKRDYVMKRNFSTAMDSKPNQRAKPSLEVNTNPHNSRINSHFPSPGAYTPYPQLNLKMSVNYLSKPVDGSNFKSLLGPIGVPPAPPSTPAAGIESLPFIYGGSFSIPAPQRPVLDSLIVAPDENSPWSHGQVGEILRKTMAHQTRQLAALSEKDARVITVLNTPPPAPVFGSGTLYKENPGRSSVERAPMAKLTVSDLRWYYALKRPIPCEMIEGELLGEVKDELKRLGIRISDQDHDGMPIDTAVRRGHPVAHSPASPPSSRIHPVLRAALDKQIYRHVRGRHYQAVVDSGPADFLNTRWDKKLQAELKAKGLGECEEQFKTTAPLRLAKKKDGDTRRVKDRDQRSFEEGSRVFNQGTESTLSGNTAELSGSKSNRSSISRRYHDVNRAVGTQGPDAGVSFVPAPEVASSEQPQNVGWFSRLLGGSQGGHSGLMKH
ncbi:unnamed protein product [Rhizoctonia solani]|uniref:Cyclin N-terminal domain-containing protein n=1 Tax=Rhizoctonia solani TaxID=456999 RepID=A0A8H3HEP6_9AGAM|nr:unnamed protein product [Rhizoctonia solani]